VTYVKRSGGVVALSLLLLGCGSNPAPGTSVIVTGDVVAIEDLVPVDGGVTITVTTQRGETERLLFPSLFTVPRPSQQTIDLYDVVRRVEVDDLIRAAGKRTTAGVELESLTIVVAR
jgi:hypothetical protein